MLDRLSIGAITVAAALSFDGFLMPTKKDQPPPDLRYFNRTQK
jgi:hypothetical protein